MVRNLGQAAGADAAERVDPQTRPLRLGLFGCPFDTGNLGVSALGYSLAHGLASLERAVDLTLFGYTRGERTVEVGFEDGPVRLACVGCHDSRRYYRWDNLRQVRAAVRLGLGGVQPMAKRLRGLDAVVDISGGDSFSDIYGMRRFDAVAMPKLTAIAAGVPLVLAPQTYGPYRSEGARRKARVILERATQVWARDERSAEVARGLLGSSGGLRSVRDGVDVAFGLPARRPRDDRLVETIERFKAGGQPVVGVNISGLLYNQPGEDVRRYGFVGSYREIVHGLLDALLAEPSLTVMLVPHVRSWRGVDCDETTIRALMSELPPSTTSRMIRVPMLSDPMEVKWVIARSSWFCGTRMHACIAGLSQGVPTAAIAYSDKTLGVFETAGMEEAVVDPRHCSAREAVSRLMELWARRDATEERLRQAMPALSARLRAQTASLLEMVR